MWINYTPIKIKIWKKKRKESTHTHKAAELTAYTLGGENWENCQRNSFIKWQWWPLYNICSAHWGMQSTGIWVDRCFTLQLDSRLSFLVCTWYGAMREKCLMIFCLPMSIHCTEEIFYFTDSHLKDMRWNGKCML